VKVEEIIKARGRKQGDLPDIKRMTQVSSDISRKANLNQAPLSSKSLIKIAQVPDSSNTSLTEDSDDKSLVNKRFSFGYSDLDLVE